MHDLDRAGRGERRRAREHLVEDGPQRVQIRARVDRAVHPGLLRGAVGEGPLQVHRQRGDAGEGAVLGGGVEVDQGETSVGVDDDVRRGQIPVQDAALVQARDQVRQLERQIQEGPGPERLAPQPLLQVLQTRVRQDQHRPPGLVLVERDRAADPVQVQPDQQRVLAVQPDRGRTARGRRLQHDGEIIPFAPGPADPVPRAPMNLLDLPVASPQSALFGSQRPAPRRPGAKFTPGETPADGFPGSARLALMPPRGGQGGIRAASSAHQRAALPGARRLPADSERR